ncbi:GAF domain-containing protein [Nocardia sp. NPDC055321]
MRRAAIVLEERDAGLQPWCASDEFASRVEAAQATAGEGPAVSAASAGVPVLVSDFAGCGHWPGFAEALTGFPTAGSMFAVPLRLGHIRLGAMDLYRDAPGRPEPLLMAAALHIADLVTASLVLSAGQEARRWSQPLSSRWIHEAAALTSARLGIGRADACARLRAYALTHEMSLVEVSKGVVQRRIVLDRE